MLARPANAAARPSNLRLEDRVLDEDPRGPADWSDYTRSDQRLPVGSHRFGKSIDP